MKPRIVVPLVVVGAMAVGGVAGAVVGVPGLSGATTSTTTAPNKAPGMKGSAHGRADLEAAAQALHLTTDELKQKLSDGKTTIADIAKQENIDINAVIDAIAGADRRRIEDFVNSPLPRFNDGADGMHAGRAFGGPMFSTAYDAAAKALGISTDELRSEMKSGKTIAQIASDKKVDVNTVINAVVAAASAQIDQAVADGKLPAKAGETMKSHLNDLVTRLVNGEMRGPGRGRGWGRGFMGPGGPMGGGPGQSA